MHQIHGNIRHGAKNRRSYERSAPSACKRILSPADCKRQDTQVGKLRDEVDLLPLTDHDRAVGRQHGAPPVLVVSAKQPRERRHAADCQDANRQKQHQEPCPAPISSNLMKEQHDDHRQADQRMKQ